MFKWERNNEQNRYISKKKRHNFLTVVFLLWFRRKTKHEQDKLWTLRHRKLIELVNNKIWAKKGVGQ